jgi:hypothetical protein
MDQLYRFVERIRGNITWVIYLKGGNNYEEGTWPPNGSKEEPVEFIQELYKKTTAEYGDGKGITAKDIGTAKEEDQVANLLFCLGLDDNTGCE